MTAQRPDTYAYDMTADHDRRNLEKIARAVADGRIDKDTATYLTHLYDDSMSWYRQVFYVLGKCFGAPKAAVMEYNSDNNQVGETPTRIIDINPLSQYIVQHRLDADPMRNQFFTSNDGYKIDLSVSSIVTVIVGAHKKIERSLDKITGKYYTDYVNDVANAVNDVLVAHNRAASGRAVADKVRKKFDNEFITTSSETILAMIGGGHENIAADLVRALDKIPKPYQRLQDVWRVKCLFDLVPQARTFIERVQNMIPDRILSIRDKFFDMDNPRNYRDAKLIINIGTGNDIVPMEIICQVRTFFECERETHAGYETARKNNNTARQNMERMLADSHAQGVQDYNKLVCNCLEDLFERVGWNILYSQNDDVSMFDGFPKNCTLYHPRKMLEIIVEKLDNAIENEVFHITNAPTKLTQAQESEILHFMARFVLVAAMPYTNHDWTMPTNNLAGRFFNFVMNEVQRYYKKK